MQSMWPDAPNKMQGIIEESETMLGEANVLADLAWRTHRADVEEVLMQSAHSRTDRELGSDDMFIRTTDHGEIDKDKYYEIIRHDRAIIDEATEKIQVAKSAMFQLEQESADHAKHPNYVALGDTARRATEARSKAMEDKTRLEKDIDAWRRMQRTSWVDGQMAIEKLKQRDRSFQMYKMLHKTKAKSEEAAERGGARGGHSASTFVPKVLSYSLTDTEVRNFKLNLSRADHRDQLDELLSYIRTKDKSIADQLDLAPDEIESAIEAGETTEEIRDAAESYIARAITLCLDDRSDRVERFKIELKQHHLRQTIRTSGSLMMQMLNKFNEAQSSTERLEDKAKYDRTTYLTTGTSADKLEAAMLKLESDWRSINLVTSNFSIHHAILDKVPHSPEAAKLAEDWRERIAIAELQRIDPTDDKGPRFYEFSLSTFRKQLARALARGGKSRMHDAQVSTVEEEDYAQECDEEAYEACDSSMDQVQEHSLYLDAFAAGVSPGSKCWSCGNVASATDHANGCTAKGPCGISYCPCNRKEPCAVRGMAILTPATTVLNAVHKPLPRSMVTILAGAQADYLKNKKGVAADVINRPTSQAGERPQYQGGKGKGGRGFPSGSYKGGRGNATQRYGGRGRSLNAAAAYDTTADMSPAAAPTPEFEVAEAQLIGRQIEGVRRRDRGYSGKIATDLSPHAGQWRANGQGHGRAPDHGLSSSMAPKRFTTSVPC